MKFIDKKTDGGRIKGKTALYCRVLEVSRQGFYEYLCIKNKPYKYAASVIAIKYILTEDEYNDNYGRIRMYQALILKQPEGVKIPCRETVRKVMRENNLTIPKKRKPNGITKADLQAQKSDNKIRRNFTAEQPFVKVVTDITEVTAKDGKSMIWHYFMSYWNNRRICCANDGLTPSFKRKRFYQNLNAVA